MRDYLHHFSEGRTTIYAHHSALVKRYSGANCDSPPSISLYTRAWIRYVQLLDVPYESGFECKVCHDNPKIVLGDGTTIGFQKKHIQPFDKENENPVQTFVGSKQKERILVEEAKWRKVILKFAKTEETKPIDRSLVHELKQQLPILRPLLKLATMENAQNNMVYCLAGFQEFICSLGTNSPVSAYIPLTGIPILQECINGLEIRKNIPK